METPVNHPGLLGSWSATRWHYTRQQHPADTLDIVCDHYATIVLSLSAGWYVLTWAEPGGKSGSIGGAWVVRQDRVEFAPANSGQIESFAFQLRPDLLSLQSEESAWDFNGSGTAEPATFIAVFVRL